MPGQQYRFRSASSQQPKYKPLPHPCKHLENLNLYSVSLFKKSVVHLSNPQTKSCIPKTHFFFQAHPHPIPIPHPRPNLFLSYIPHAHSAKQISYLERKLHYVNPRNNSSKIWVGMCRVLPEIFYLFQPKICQTKNRYLILHFDFRMHLRRASNFYNHKEFLSTRYTSLLTTVYKPNPISNQMIINN